MIKHHRPSPEALFPEGDGAVFGQLCPGLLTIQGYEAATAQHSDDIEEEAKEILASWSQDLPAEALDFLGVDMGLLLRRAVSGIISRHLRTRDFAWAVEKDGTLARDAARYTAAGRLLHVLARQIQPSGWACGVLGPLIASSDLKRMRKVVAAAGDKPRILVRYADRLVPVMEALEDRGRVQLITADSKRKRAKAPSATFTIAPFFTPPAADLDRITQSVVQGLTQAGIDTSDADITEVRRRLRLEMSRLMSIDKTLRAAQPSALLVLNDSTPDGLTWVLAARKHGVPSISVQHGLDCEHHILDRAFTDVKCVWGEAMAKRYAAASDASDVRLQVTGYPGHDRLHGCHAPSAEGGHLLWVTRPHTPDKCWTPSRFVHEGLAIFDALVEALKSHPEAHLKIKPHPADYTDLYAAKIRQYGLGGRVMLTNAPLEQLLPATTAVICEDSTGALDAMLHGKALVHVHFGPSEPVLPLGAYGAALRARDADELSAAVNDVVRQPGKICFAQMRGRERFVEDYCGPMDGGATRRVADIIEGLAAPGGAKLDA